MSHPLHQDGFSQNLKTLKFNNSAVGIKADPHSCNVKHLWLRKKSARNCRNVKHAKHVKHLGNLWATCFGPPPKEVLYVNMSAVSSDFWVNEAKKLDISVAGIKMIPTAEMLFLRPSFAPKMFYMFKISAVSKLCFISIQNSLTFQLWDQKVIATAKI